MTTIVDATAAKDDLWKAHREKPWGAYVVAMGVRHENGAWYILLMHGKNLPADITIPTEHKGVQIKKTRLTSLCRTLV